MTKIFLTNGTLIKNERSIGNIMTYQPFSSGIYIVVIGSKRFEILVP